MIFVGLLPPPYPSQMLFPSSPASFSTMRICSRTSANIEQSKQCQNAVQLVPIRRVITPHVFRKRWSRLQGLSAAYSPHERVLHNCARPNVRTAAKETSVPVVCWYRPSCEVYLGSILMGRSRRLGAGVEVASWVFLLSVWTEASTLSTGYIGRTATGYKKVTRNVAVASCPLTSRSPGAAVPLSLLKTSYGGSHSWRNGVDNCCPCMGRLLRNKSIVDDTARTAETNRYKDIGSPRSSSTCLRGVADSSGGSDYSEQEERASGDGKPTGNILQRLSIVALERPAEAFPRPTTLSTQTSLSVLPSDPIKRFSSDRRHGYSKAVGNKQTLSATTPSTSSDNVSTSSGPSALKAVAEAGGAPSSSLADRLAAELRRRRMLSRQLHLGTRNQSGKQGRSRGIDHGVQQLNSVIARVEAKINDENSEAGQSRVRNHHRVRTV